MHAIWLFYFPDISKNNFTFVFSNTEKNGVCILMEPNAMYNKAKSFYCEDYIVEMCAVTTNWSLHLCKLSYIKRYSPCLGQEFTITVNTQIKRKRNSVMR